MGRLFIPRKNWPQNPDNLRDEIANYEAIERWANNEVMGPSGVVPFGKVAYVTQPVSQSIGAALVDVPGLTWTGKLYAGRRYKVTASAYAVGSMTAAPTEAYWNIVVDGTLISEARTGGWASATINPGSFMAVGVFTTTTTSHTVKVQAQALAGTMTIFAAATTPMQLLIEDIGA